MEGMHNTARWHITEVPNKGHAENDIINRVNTLCIIFVEKKMFVSTTGQQVNKMILQARGGLYILRIMSNVTL